VFREQAAAAREETDNGDESLEPVRFIHLMNARTLAPGGSPIPANRGVWWRGRLDSVDGWCFGELSTA